MLFDFVLSYKMVFPWLWSVQLLTAFWFAMSE
jgi:hypothetical protein